MDNDKDKKCAICERELIMGIDVVGQQQGVIGPRGFVALEDMQLFCNEECLDKHCCEVNEGKQKLTRRVP